MRYWQHTVSRQSYPILEQESGNLAPELQVQIMAYRLTEIVQGMTVPVF